MLLWGVKCYSTVFVGCRRRGAKLYVFLINEIMSLLHREDFLIFLNELQKLLWFCCKFANSHAPIAWQIAMHRIHLVGVFWLVFLHCLFSPCCLKDESIWGDYAESSTFPNEILCLNLFFLIFHSRQRDEILNWIWRKSCSLFF